MEASAIMSPDQHIFHEIFLHINWHCQSDQNFIKPEVETHLFRLIEEYCRKYNGVYYHGVGGTENHVHLAIQCEPNVSSSEFIGRVKGFTSHEINKQFRSKKLYWQKGYGVVSFAKSNLPGVQKYIENQKEHHANNATRDTLEKCYLDKSERFYNVIGAIESMLKTVREATLKRAFMKFVYRSHVPSE